MSDTSPSGQGAASATTSTGPALSPTYLAQDDSTKVIIVMWVVTGLPILFMALRLYTRGVLARNRFGWDDVIAIAALLCLISYSAVTTVGAQHGLGRHVEAVAAENPNHLITIALMAQIGEAFAVMSCTLGKTSFAVTLLRIVVQKWIIWLLWFVIITMNLVNVLTVFFIFLQCEHPRHLWNPAIPSKCWTTIFTRYSLFVGAYSGAQDFVLAAIPWFVIVKLQMRKKEKLAIAFAMSLGVFAGATAIVKTTYLVALSKKTDFTWALAPLLMWAAAEDGLTLVAASIPTLRPLLRAVFPQTSSLGESHQSYGRKYNKGANYEMGGHSRTNSGMTGNMQYFVDPKTHGSSKARAYAGRKHSMDDTSDRSILDKTDGGSVWANGSGDGKIRTTTTVTVDRYGLAQ